MEYQTRGGLVTPAEQQVSTKPLLGSLKQEI